MKRLVLTWLGLVASLLSVLSLGGCNARLFFADAPLPAVTLLDHADHLPLDSATPPADETPGWHAVTLPDLLSQRSIVQRGGWYRLHVSLAAPPEEMLGVYLHRLSMNAALYVNGVFVGDGGRMEEPLTRNWNMPLYFTLPPSLLRVGDNQLLIRLRTDPGYGILPPVQIGPERILRPLYEVRRFLQVEASAILCFALVGMALFMFGIWLRRPKDRLYLWFAGSSLLWALFGMYFFVRNPGVSASTFRWFTHVCIDWWIAVFAGFVHRFVGHQRPRLERAFLLAALCGSICSAAAPSLAARAYMFRVSHAITLGIGVYLVIDVAWNFWRRRTPELGLLCGALTALVLTGVHDFVLSIPTRFVPRAQLAAAYGRSFFFLHYMAPLVFFFLAWHLSRRFVNALNESELLNTELEARVERAQNALERSFSARRELEREQAAAEARERVYRDLHDDIGAKLLSLAIAADSPQQAETARAALRDLREVVSHSGRGPTPLGELLADWRFEIGQRTSAAQVGLVWHEEGPPPPLVVPADSALNLSRILREAVSNVLRHANASHLTIVIAFSATELSLAIIDDGQGMAQTKSPREGRGMRNLRSRAALLDGTIAWLSAEPHGVRIELRVPLGKFPRAGSDSPTPNETA